MFLMSQQWLSLFFVLEISLIDIIRVQVLITTTEQKMMIMLILYDAKTKNDNIQNTIDMFCKH